MNRRGSFAVMGTAASLVAPLSGRDFDRALTAVTGVLRDAEQRFSPYLPDSELSLLRRGVIDEAAVSKDMASVLRGCRLLETLTDGAFRPRTPGGVLDTTGFVKGWAMAQAGEALRGLGSEHWLLTVGGEVLAAGGNGDRPWHVALRHPDRAGRVAAVIPVRDGAVATSGNYERGAHIWDRDGRMEIRRGSVTITGPRIEIADALATAAWAAGDRGAALVARVPQYQMLQLDAAGTRASRGFPTVAPAA